MIKLTPGKLTLPQLRRIARERVQLTLDPASHAAIDACAKAVEDIAAKGLPAYGINTGFGRLANTHIPADQLELLQRNLVLSHAVGVGEPMSPPVVRLLMALKLSSLGRGHSGIRRVVMDAMITLFNADILPVIPVKGSVGASGDLAPLAHMSGVLLGIGEVFIEGKQAPALDGLKAAGLEPLTLQAKEGLALAQRHAGFHGARVVQHVRDRRPVPHGAGVGRAVGGCRRRFRRSPSMPASTRCAVTPDRSMPLLRIAPCWKAPASTFRMQDCDKVQDPYSLRCQPQVMGACLDQMRHAADVLLIEANAVSDNPLIFPDTGEVLSGGNFHAEPVAFAADNLAIAAAEIGALAERRIALLIDATLSGLPPFLVRDGGVNSGFMIAHVTAAALASENKTYAHPASVDSLPTSANQEDHVSMATFAARKLGYIAENVAHILAIELLAAAQGVDLRAPHQTSPRLQPVMQSIRADVEHYALDHYFAPDIVAVAKQVTSGTIAAFCPLHFASEGVA